MSLHFLWAHLGSNQGPTDYESSTVTGTMEIWENNLPSKFRDAIL